METQRLKKKTLWLVFMALLLGEDVCEIIQLCYLLSSGKMTSMQVTSSFLKLITFFFSQ